MKTVAHHCGVLYCGNAPDPDFDWDRSADKSNSQPAKHRFNDVLLG